VIPAQLATGRLREACQVKFTRGLLFVLGQSLFRLRLEFEGLELVPPDEPLIVAAAPHRNWIDPFLIVMALPSRPRIYFLGSGEGTFNRWWKRLIIGAVGGVVPVSTIGQLNREGLQTALAILAAGRSLGLMPEGWDQEAQPPDQIAPIKRGVAFLAERSQRRVLPVGLAGTQELWRGKTLRLRVGAPLDPPALGAPRAEEQAFAARLTGALLAALPPLPPEPADGRKRWPWLTRLLY
jgi:1-acyl-sn-glycerol-3-phosphate acyltransferase